jgi:hypothetical protein
LTLQPRRPNAPAQLQNHQKNRPIKPPNKTAKQNRQVMEYCDAGTLLHALKAGAFHRRLEGGQIGVDLAAILEVLNEVAGSIYYFHGLQLLHCDIKVRRRAGTLFCLEFSSIITIGCWRQAVLQCLLPHFLTDANRRRANEPNQTGTGGQHPPEERPLAPPGVHPQAGRLWADQDPEGRVHPQHVRKKLLRKLLSGGLTGF